MVAMPHLSQLDWTPDNRLLHIQRGSSQTWYTYDSTGQRVRKLTDKGGLTEERLYLGGFEIYRKRQGSTVVLERETLHIMDGNRRVALVETKTIDTSTTRTLPDTVTRYQLDNHLQSASLELDDTAQVISYEEYYPYGDTSYRSAKSGVEVSEKRYRYTGKEKDEESGLYYHGARYYASWLGRWTAADPAGMVDGACLYAYVRNHPTGLVDPDGRAGTEPDVMMQTAMRMLNDQINTVTNFLSELPFGGHGKADVAANRMEWRRPEGGVGGVAGGVVRTVSLRSIPMEKNPTEAGRFGMELGASAVPVLDPAERLISGRTVSGQHANRAVAGLELAATLLPFAKAKLPSPSASLEPEAFVAGRRPPSPGMQADMAGDILPFEKGYSDNIQVVAEARKQFSFSFYQEHTGWAPQRIESHISGIDFLKPVEKTTIEAGAIMEQHGFPGDPTGNYFSTPGTPSYGLGIYTNGRLTSQYRASQATPALKSTAASVTDTWSVQGLAIEAPGSQTQFFVPMNSIMKKVAP